MSDTKIKFKFDRKDFLRKTLDPPHYRYADMPQNIVSEKTGISQPKLSRIKNDPTQTLQLSEYIKLCNVYGLDPKRFIKEDLFGE